MTNAIILRSGVNRKVHAPFWSRVERGDPLGLGNIQTTQKEEFSNGYVDGIIDVHNSNTRKEFVLQKEQQYEQSLQIDKSKEFEISI